MINLYQNMILSPEYSMKNNHQNVLIDMRVYLLTPYDVLIIHEYTNGDVLMVSVYNQLHLPASCNCFIA